MCVRLQQIALVNETIDIEASHVGDGKYYSMYVVM